MVGCGEIGEGRQGANYPGSWARSFVGNRDDWCVWLRSPRECHMEARYQRGLLAPTSQEWRQSREGVGQEGVFDKSREAKVKVLDVPGRW